MAILQELIGCNNQNFIPDYTYICFILSLHGLNFAGVSESHNIFIINFNCSKFEKEPGRVFHPYRRQVDGSNQVEMDYCVECRCDEVCSETV